MLSGVRKINWQPSESFTTLLASDVRDSWVSNAHEASTPSFGNSFVDPQALRSLVEGESRARGYLDQWHAMHAKLDGDLRAPIQALGAEPGASAVLGDLQVAALSAASTNDREVRPLRASHHEQR